MYKSKLIYTTLKFIFLDTIKLKKLLFFPPTNHTTLSHTAQSFNLKMLPTDSGNSYPGGQTPTSTAIVNMQLYLGEREYFDLPRLDPHYAWTHANHLLTKAFSSSWCASVNPRLTE